MLDCTFELWARIDPLSFKHLMLRLSCHAGLHLWTVSQSRVLLLQAVSVRYFVTAWRNAMNSVSLLLSLLFLHHFRGHCYFIFFILFRVHVTRCRLWTVSLHGNSDTRVLSLILMISVWICVNNSHESSRVFPSEFQNHTQNSNLHRLLIKYWHIKINQLSWKLSPVPPKKAILSCSQIWQETLFIYISSQAANLMNSCFYLG